MEDGWDTLFSIKLNFESHIVKYLSVQECGLRRFLYEQVLEDNVVCLNSSEYEWMLKCFKKDGKHISSDGSLTLEKVNRNYDIYHFNLFQNSNGIIRSTKIDHNVVEDLLWNVMFVRKLLSVHGNPGQFIFRQGFLEKNFEIIKQL